MRPGQFIMERGMLLGIKERAELLAESGSMPLVQESTPTPEVFIPLDKAIPDKGIRLEGVQLDIVNTTLASSFPPKCSGSAAACTQAPSGYKMLSVTIAARALPEGQMLPYKNLPTVSVAMEGKAPVRYSLTKYDNETRTLTLGFEVPESARVFGLKWADLAEIPLDVAE